MNILAIDLSLNSTGMCLNSNDSKVLKHPYFAGGASCGDSKYSFFLIAFPPPRKNRPGPSREAKWRTIVDSITGLLDYTDLVVIEDYAFGAVGRGKSVLCEVGGIVRYTLDVFNKTPILVSPTTLKRFMQVKSKAGVLKEVYKRYQIDLDSDDLADALVLMKIAEAIESQEGIPQFQLDAVKAAHLIE